jgi:uncharacterized membrane protein YkvA (DUF1232 family)
VVAVSEHFDAFKEWVRTLREDVNTLKRCVENAKASSGGRRHAAAALNYLVTRMDLVPDWEESIGTLDDAMVLRVLVRLGMQDGIDDGLDASTLVAIGRLENEAQRVEDFLEEEELYDKFRKYCAQLTRESVRGRSPHDIVEDAKVRDALFREVDEELERQSTPKFGDADKLAVKFRAYLRHKL